MSKHSANTPEVRARLRQQWLEQAQAVFDLYFPDGQTEPPTSFSQREQRACDLTHELAAWLLEQDLDQDPAARPDERQGVACPKCGPPAQRRTKPGEPLPRRQLTSDAGEVTFRREQWHC